MQKPDLKIATALDAYYFEHVRVNAVSPITVENNIHNLKSHFGAESAIKDIDIPACRGYATARDAKASTIAKELGTLKAAAHHAVKWKRLSLADMPTFEMPRVTVNKSAWLFPDELEALKKGASSLQKEAFPLRTLCFIQLCYYTASRREAIESLSWRQIDVEKRRISLAKPGERTTKKRRPTVAVDPKLLPALKHLRAHTESDIFGGRMDGWFHNAALAGGVAQLPERESRPAVKITPHMLRHSRATHLLQAGKDPWAVANLLGDTLSTVERVYGHHCALHTEVLFEQEKLTDILS